VAHYTSALLGALARRFPDDEWRAFVPGPGSPPIPTGVTPARHPLPSRVLFGAGALVGRPRLDRLLGGGVDVVWIPAPAPVRISAGLPYVVTVHDLSWAERPGDFTAYERAWHRAARVDRLLAGASLVVTDTAAVARGLCSVVPPGRVRVVVPGVTRRVAGSPPPGLPERFVLAVGALEPRKDPELLVRAHAGARQRGLDAELVFAGTGRLAGRLRAPGVHLLGAVDDATLGALYERALVLAMPSLLEGFGFPPLEAALAGTPSIVSDLPVFRETLGDAATFVPAGDEGAWTEALLTWRTPDPRHPRAEVEGGGGLTPATGEGGGGLTPATGEGGGGQAPDRRFSWVRAAEELRAVLAEAAG